jgi:hypothetical protein
LSDSFDLDSDDEIFISQIEKKKTLYDGSQLELNDFNIAFMATVEKLDIGESQRDLVLDLIRLTAPLINNLPTSYRRIRNSLEKPDMTETLICYSCFKEIDRKMLEKGKKNKERNFKKCLTKECRSNRIGLKSNMVIKVYEANIFSQIELILRENTNIIEKYKGIY